jgi:aryl-alcohol dehydrogenase-like predicted oxidoreductase
VCDRAGAEVDRALGVASEVGGAVFVARHDGSLRDLGVERIDLYQLHRVDPRVPIEETMGVLTRLRDEGKIRHVGLSEVGVDQIARARSVIPIATVQNEYNLANRRHEDVLDFCEAHRMGFIPFYPLKVGALAESDALKSIATRERVTPRLIALAWLLARSPAVIAIPGTSSVTHLDENVGACDVRLSSADMSALNGLPSAKPLEVAR